RAVGGTVGFWMPPVLGFCRLYFRAPSIALLCARRLRQLARCMTNGLDAWGCFIYSDYRLISKINWKPVLLKSITAQWKLDCRESRRLRSFHVFRNRFSQRRKVRCRLAYPTRSLPLCRFLS